MRLTNKIHFRNLRGDLFGGITAAVVALPLALAFGVASGAGAIAGLYGAVIIGFFAALFGGTPTQISGPTGPMTVVMTTVIASLIRDNPENGMAMAFTVVMVAGLFQILFGILKFGVYITLMPYTVISGFMSGIGVIIILIEIPPLLGHPNAASVIEAVRMLPEHVQTLNPIATLIGILTLLIVFLTPKRVNSIVPAPLIALVFCTILSVTAFGGFDFPRIGDIPQGLPELHMPVFSAGQMKTIFGYGLMLATLGAIDSLLTSLVADNITRTQHDSDRELIGQGLGNLLSGLCGGLPGAGATMRTVINVRAGGITALSGIVHALVLFMIVLGAGSLTENIPHTVLAGILLKVGIDIIDWSFIKKAHHISLRGTALMYGVLILTVFVDLITAVAIGVFIANLFTIKKLTDLQVSGVSAISEPDDNSKMSNQEKILLTQAQGRILLFCLGGPMSFGAAKTISQRLSIVAKYEVLILDFSDVPHLGVTASLAIENMINEANSKQRQIFLVGAQGNVKQRLINLKVLDKVPPENNVSDRLQALKESLQILNIYHEESFYEESFEHNQFESNFENNQTKKRQIEKNQVKNHLHNGL